LQLINIIIIMYECFTEFDRLRPKLWLKKEPSKVLFQEYIKIPFSVPYASYVSLFLTSFITFRQHVHIFPIYNTTLTRVIRSQARHSIASSTYLVPPIDLIFTWKINLAASSKTLTNIYQTTQHVPDYAECARLRSMCRTTQNAPDYAACAGLRSMCRITQHVRSITSSSISISTIRITENVQIIRFETSTKGNRITFRAAIAPSGPAPTHYPGFTIALRYTTLSRTPPDE
jgi:hypothetical protein